MSADCRTEDIKNYIYCKDHIILIYNKLIHVYGSVMHSLEMVNTPKLFFIKYPYIVLY